LKEFLGDAWIIIPKKFANAGRRFVAGNLEFENSE
jgi:hypothetical protein